MITHAHGDHARPGQRRVSLRGAVGAPLLRAAVRRRRRDRDAFAYGQPLTLGGVRVSFHPAGHVLGSAQVRIEGRDGVWVVSGDYKRAPDPTCAPFEPRAVRHVHHRIDVRPADLPLGSDRGRSSPRSWRGGTETATAALTSVLFCYTLGKAQRILAELTRVTDRPVYVHGMMLADDRRVSRAPASRCCRRVPLIERARAARVVRRRAGAGAALGARHAVDAAARRRLRRLRLRPDARARRAPAARLRSRLRAVRSRRLAGAAGDDRGDRGAAASSPRTATRSRSRATSRRAGSTSGVHPDRVGRAKPGGSREST